MAETRHSWRLLCALSVLSLHQAADTTNEAAHTTNKAANNTSEAANNTNEAANITKEAIEEDTEGPDTIPRMIGPEGSNSYVLGARKPGDTLLETIPCERPGEEEGVFEMYYKYPLKCHQDHTKVITCIQVNDRDTNDTGPWTKVTSGGVGHTNVSFALRSCPPGGMNVTIEIYGI